jgi:hypothetical protein
MITVGIVTGYRLDDGLSSSPGTVKNFLFSTSSRLVLSPIQSPFQQVAGAKQPGREADN